MKNNIGEILYTLRSEKKISQEELCRGLCTKGAYSRYESGERLPDRLLLNALLQRMGKSADKLSTILTNDEYIYLTWKKEALIAMGSQNVDKLKKLLKQYEEFHITVNANLQQQFVYQIEAVIAEHEGKNLKECLGLVERAIELSMPNIKTQKLEEYLISTEEMRLLLNLSFLLIQDKQEEYAYQLLSQIVEYAEKHFDDYEAKVKIFPKTVKALFPLLIQRQKKAEAMLLCEKAIQLLCLQGVLYDLMELLDEYEQNNFSEFLNAHCYRKQLQVLKELCTEYEICQEENSLLAYSNQEIYLLNEVLYFSRAEKAFSQEKLSEGICSPESLSRIESGKRNPHSKHFYELMTKLETDLDYYNGGLDTTDFWLLEKKMRLDRTLSLQKWSEAYPLIKELKSELDMNSYNNQQVMDSIENCVLYNMGKLTSEEFLNSCFMALGCNRDDWHKEEFWTSFFPDYKITLLNYVALLYEKNGKLENSIYILEHLLHQLEKSKVKFADRYKSSITIIGNLSSYYGITGKIEQCLDMCERGIRLCLECGRGVRLANFLVNKAEALNEKTKTLTEESRKYLEWGYYLSKLMSTPSLTSYIDAFYREHYDSQVIWD